MGILLNNNSGALLAVFTRDVFTLAENATNITNGINATLACQSTLNSSNVEYDACLTTGYTECSAVSARETQIQASLSVSNLTSTRNSIQWACNNRTALLNAEIQSFVAVASNTTVVQNGTLLVTVQGGGISISSTYIWKRTVIGTEFKLDSLILASWPNIPIIDSIVNATITFDTFVPPVCLYQNQLPLFESPFVGATVTTYQGNCTNIVFNVNGIIDAGGIGLATDFGIFF